MGMIELQEDRVLVDDWHPVAAVADVPAGKLLPDACGARSRLVAAADGNVRAWEDRVRTAARACPSDASKATEVVWRYHGWHFRRQFALHPDSVATGSRHKENAGACACLSRCREIRLGVGLHRHAGCGGAAFPNSTIPICAKVLVRALRRGQQRPAHRREFSGHAHFAMPYRHPRRPYPD